MGVTSAHWVCQWPRWVWHGLGKYDLGEGWPRVGGGGWWGVGLQWCGMTTVCVAWTQRVLNCLCGCKFTSVAVAWPHWVCHRLSVSQKMLHGLSGCVWA